MASLLTRYPGLRLTKNPYSYYDTASTTATYQIGYVTIAHPACQSGITVLIKLDPDQLDVVA